MVDPVISSYRGLQVVGAPPSSSGIVVEKNRLRFLRFSTCLLLKTLRIVVVVS